MNVESNGTCWIFWRSINWLVYLQTLSTLRYANRAKNIKNKPKINEDPKVRPFINLNYKSLLNSQKKINIWCWSRFPNKKMTCHQNKCFTCFLNVLFTKGCHAERIPVRDREAEADDRERRFRGRGSCPQWGNSTQLILNIWLQKTTQDLQFKDLRIMIALYNRSCWRQNGSAWDRNMRRRWRRCGKSKFSTQTLFRSLW